MQPLLHCSEHSEGFRQLNLYQSQLLQTQQNLDDTEYQLQFSNLYINMISINQQLCYYECLAREFVYPSRIALYSSSS